MKSIPSLFAIAGALGLILVAQPADACQRKGHHRGGKAHHLIKMIVRSAELTPDQKRQLKAMRKQFKQERQGVDKSAFRAQRQAMKQKMAAAIESGDSAELEELFALKSELQAKHQRMKLKKLSMVLSILTDEQRARVAQKMRRKHARRGKWGGGDAD